MGRYNNHSAGKWFAQADFILIEQEWVKKWQTETLNSGLFMEIGSDFPLGQCDSSRKTATLPANITVNQPAHSLLESHHEINEKY